MEKTVIVLNAVPGSECRIARSTSQRHDLSDSVTAGPERNNTSSKHYSSNSSQNTSKSAISPSSESQHNGVQSKAIHKDLGC